MSARPRPRRFPEAGLTGPIFERTILRMESPARPPFRWGLPLAVALVSFATFLPALWCGWVNWDDPVNFQNNPHYRGLGPDQLTWMWTNFTGHYMPLTWMTLGVDYLLWGMKPWGYHLSNVVIHAFNAALCFLFLEALLRRSAVARDASDSALRACAAAGALLWAVHPLRVESVAWVTERRDLVAGLFTFPCLIAYLRALPTGNVGRADPRLLAASAGFFALSMLGKAIGMTLPVALLVMDAFPLGRFAAGADGRRPWRSVLLEKWPFLLVMIGGVGMTALGQERAGALHDAGSHGPSNFLVQPGWRLGFYLWKLLVPLGLSPLYPFHRHEPWAVRYFVVGAAVLALAILAWRFRRQAPGLLASLAAFAILLGPVLGPIQAGPHFAADRYTYLAALPFSALAAGALLAWVLRRPRPAPAIAAGAWLAALAALSAVQCLVWKDSIALWTQAANVDPSSSTIFSNRGAAYAARQRFEEALADFSKAIEMTPNSHRPWANRARAHIDMGRIPEAQRDADTAVRLAPDDPFVWVVRAEMHLAAGRPPDAIRDFTRAIEVDRAALQGWLGRSRARGMSGDLRGSIQDSDIALLLHPGHAEARMNRALAKGELGDLDGAVADYEAALAIDATLPEAWAGRGMIRAMQNRWTEAAADFEQALAVAPATWPHRRDATARLQEARARARLR